MAAWLVAAACCHGHLSSNRCLAGVAGYTWVAILHVWLGLTFKTTLVLANITSVAWLCIYHGVLPAPKAQAVSQLHTLSSRNSSASAEHSQTDVHGPALVSNDNTQDLEGPKFNAGQVRTSLCLDLRFVYRSVITWASDKHQFLITDPPSVLLLEAVAKFVMLAGLHRGKLRQMRRVQSCTMTSYALIWLCERLLRRLSMVV